MMTSAPAAGNNKGQQSRREGAAEGRGWTGGMTRRSGGRGVGRRGRRTSKAQVGEGVVVCPGAVGVLPGGQCIRQRLGSLGSDLLSAAPEAAAATCNSHSEQGRTLCPHQAPHPLNDDGCTCRRKQQQSNNKGQQSRREGAAERRGWRGRMTRRSGGGEWAGKEGAPLRFRVR